MKHVFTLRFLIGLMALCASVQTSAQLVVINGNDSGTGSLRQQVTDAEPGDLIVIINPVTEIELSSGPILIDKSLTITGNGILLSTITSNNSSRIFDITSGSVILNTLTLQDAAADDGGAIHLSNATLTLNATSISNCSATGASGSGGAIFVGSGATLNVSNSFFSGNLANRAGGAIESTAGTTVTLTTVVFENNKAGVAPAVANPGNGGAFHITGNGNATINGGMAGQNQAASEGGAFWNGTGTMTVSGTVVTGNEAMGAAADNGGGGFYNLNGGTLNLNSVTLADNHATGTSGSGGGVLNDVGATLNVDGGVIATNTANRAGGGIENNAGTVTLGGVEITANETFTSPGNGGGLHVTGAGTVTISEGLVAGNLAGAEGGGLWNGTGTMSITGTQILGNTASGAAADQGGGGIYNLNGGTLLISGATINGNVANGALGSGGGILNDVGSQLTIADTEIAGNTAVRAGGGIEDNSGTSTIILNNVTLNGNSTSGPPGNGGGLHITGGGSLTMTGGAVTGNTAGLEGGGLWNGSGTMTLNGVVISENIASGAAADDGGGGVFNTSGTLIIADSDISMNLANGTSGSGGGIFSLDGPVTVTNSSISENSANRAGGGIEIVNGLLTVSDCHLTQNDVNGGAGTANPGNGGAFHVTGAATIVFTDSAILGNEAMREGGGLWNQTGSTMSVTACTIDGNVASGPDATHGGGGIFNNGGMLQLERSTVSNNQSTGAAANGGGIHVKAGEVAVLASTISGNQSANNGGGIYNNAQFSANAITVANNMAGLLGGGLSSASPDGASLKNSLIVSNTAEGADDLHVSGSAVASLGFNLIGQADASDFESVQPSDQLGDSENPLDAMLGDLADNGGPTWTHALLENSPAYNAGDPADLFNDQIGSPVFGGIRDTGAFEAQEMLGAEAFASGSQNSIIYPNPSRNGLLNIGLSSGFMGSADVQIVEIGSGRIIREMRLDSEVSQIDLSGNLAGVYVVRIASDQFVESHKVVLLD